MSTTGIFDCATDTDQAENITTTSTEQYQLKTTDLAQLPTGSARASHDLLIHDLAIVLGNRRVLDQVNLEVPTGSFTALVGPNGAGKTTLLRGILGLARLATGTIAIGDKPSTQWLRRIGYVPQRHAFAWDFPISVEEVVLSGRVRHIGWFHRAKVADHLLVAKALDKVKMSKLAKRPVGELSGGQRQRVLIARALAGDPKLLLLDEPFTGLDMPTQELLNELFQSVAAEGTTVLMTTHDLPSAMALCDQVALINQTIVAHGTPEYLRCYPQSWMQTFHVCNQSPLLSSIGISC